MDRRGFTAIEVVVAVVIVAMIGAAAYMFLAKPGSSGSSTNQTASTPAYQSDADLQQATQQLDDTSVDNNLDTSLTQLDQQASGF